MKKRTIENLPDVLEPSDIKEYLKISKTAAYQLVQSNQFHVVKVGRKYKIPKNAFIKWFEGNDRN